MDKTDGLKGEKIMPKIYLSPAMHRWNPCAYNGTDETTENNAYCDALEPYLKACGFEVKRGIRRTPMSNEDGNAIMWQNIRESNAWGADLHYISHTNAANGEVRGYRPIIYPTGNEAGERLAKILTEKRAEIYNGPIQIDRRSDLAELNSTNALAYYEEHIFHDNFEDDRWFNENLDSIARKTAEGLCEFFGMEFVDPYKEKLHWMGYIGESTDPSFVNGWVWCKEIEHPEVHIYAFNDETKEQIFLGKCIADRDFSDLKEIVGSTDHAFWLDVDSEKFGQSSGDYTIRAYMINPVTDEGNPCLGNEKKIHYEFVAPIQSANDSKDTGSEESKQPEGSAADAPPSGQPTGANHLKCLLLRMLIKWLQRLCRRLHQ